MYSSCRHQENGCDAGEGWRLQSTDQQYPSVWQPVVQQQQQQQSCIMMMGKHATVSSAHHHSWYHCDDLQHQVSMNGGFEPLHYHHHHPHHQQQLTHQFDSPAVIATQSSVVAVDNICPGYYVADNLQHGTLTTPVWATSSIKIASFKCRFRYLSWSRQCHASVYLTVLLHLCRRCTYPKAV